MKLLEADKIGSCPIDSVKLCDAKEWALRMKEKGISYKNISNDKHSLKAAFYTAIRDDCITMTLNYYAHATFASAKAEMERLIA